MNIRNIYNKILQKIKSKESYSREKIEILFGSGDKGMQKLGQKICHQYRISYYVEVVPYNYNGRKIMYKCISFSTYKIKRKFIQSLAITLNNDIQVMGLLNRGQYDKKGLQGIYKIKLCNKN